MVLPDNTIEIFPATALAHPELLRPVLESTVRNPITAEVFRDEIEEILDSVQGSLRQATGRYYAIAQSSGSMVVGMMGLQLPDEAMLPFATTDNPVEIINAYVLDVIQGHGAGSALVQHLQDKAKNEGHTEVVVNSGPRYMPRGWRFWTNNYGQHVGEIKDHYGPGYHARVWRHTL